MSQVVLLSGGIDSLVCAELARRDGDLAGCVFVDYGHPAQVPEGWKAFAYCGARNIPLKVVHVFGLDLGGMGDASGARVVPHRNAILIAVAANAARALGGSQLVIGVTAEDQADYADCRPAFLAGLAGAIKMGISSPLVDRTKRQIVEMAVEFGLRREDAWECYGAGPVPCGACPCCRRAEAAWSALESAKEAPDVR